MGRRETRKLKKISIGDNDAGQRADKFFKKAFPRIPVNLLYKYFRTRKFKRNGKRLFPDEILSSGDILELYINDDLLDASAKSTDFLRADNTLDVLYEDENILLMNKPAGLIVHEDNREFYDTLINRMLRYLYERGEYLPSAEQSFTPALCNRLDRNTSGIVIGAKNAETLRTATELIREKQVDKRYLCIVVGVPPPGVHKETAYHFKDERKNRVYLSKEPKPGYREIITEYSLIETDGKLSLLEVNLITGRTHQIRAHLAFLGYPLLGDGKYGEGEINRKYGVKTQQLCSYKLCFDSKGTSLGYLDGRLFELPDVKFQIEI